MGLVDVVNFTNEHIYHTVDIGRFGHGRFTRESVVSRMSLRHRTVLPYINGRDRTLPYFVLTYKHRVGHYPRSVAGWTMLLQGKLDGLA